jgi:hypothetical protein
MRTPTAFLVKESLERMQAFFGRYREKYPALEPFLDLLERHEGERIVALYNLLEDKELPPGTMIRGLIIMSEINYANHSAAELSLQAFGGHDNKNDEEEEGP